MKSIKTKKELLILFQIVLISTILNAKSNNSKIDLYKSYLSQKESRNKQSEIQLERIHSMRGKASFNMTSISNSNSSTSNIRFIGRWGYGRCNNVEAKNDTIYLGTGGVFQIVDFKNAKAPKLISELLLPGSFVEGSCINDGYAYVANATHGLRIINLSNPQNIQEVGFFDTDSIANDVVVKDNYAYIADGTNGLVIIDISQKSNPIFISHLNIEGTATKLSLSGNYLYVAASSGGVRIIDISNPYNPKEASYLYTGSNFNYTTDVLVKGNYAYATDYNTGLFIFDVSNPQNPREISFLEINYGSSAIALSEDRLFIAADFLGIFVIDISNPLNPQEMDRLYTAEDAVDITISGNNAYLANLGDGVRVIDILNPNGLLEKGVYDTRDYASDVAISGDYAYIANVRDGLRVIDISNKANPQEVNSIELKSDTKALLINSNYCYIGDGINGLKIYNLSLPANLTEIGSLQTCWVSEIAYNNNYLYTCGYSDIYHSASSIIDVYQPSNPRIINSSINSGEYDVKDNYLFIANSDALFIMDITSPRNPQKIAVWENDDGNGPIDVVVKGNYAFVIDIKINTFYDWEKDMHYYTFNSYLRSIDISNPSNPKVVCSINTENSDSYGQCITIENNYAFIGIVGGFKIIDITNPTNLKEIGNYTSNDNYPLNINVKNNYIYLADGAGGLYIYEFLGSSPESPTLLRPIANSIIKKNLPKFSWNVPVDPDGDSLHFKIDISSDNTFANPIPDSPFESIINSTGFNPIPPVIEGKDSCIYSLSNALNDGDYYWRVAATDGKSYGNYSTARKFTIDTAPPYTSNHNPSKNSANNPLNTDIVVNVQDITSGVNISTISMKINGKVVTPSITGNSKNTILSYNPPIDFNYNDTVNVSVDAIDNAGNIMTTDNYCFYSITDHEPPFTTNHSPEKNAQEIPINSNILVHIQDSISGVKRSSIIMKVNELNVTPVITGSPLNYLLTYNPSKDFDYNDTIYVSINANDNAGNIMDLDNYFFITQKPTPITITYPDSSGIIWLAGQEYTIHWISTGDVDQYVSIELYSGNTINNIISSNTENDGNFVWKVPVNQIPGSDYKIKITSQSDTTIYDFSDNTFSIEEPPQIKITQPDTTGIVWQAGHSYEIRWIFSGNPSQYVKIELFNKNTFTRTITNSTENDRSFNWFIPLDIKSDSYYKIKISSIIYPSVFDTSTNPFTIKEAPPLIVTCPDSSGIIWKTNENHIIKWVSIGNVGPFVKIVLLKGAAVNRIIAESVENNGNYNWHIPLDQQTGTDFLVKISSVVDANIYDSSDNYFTIEEIKAVFVTCPDSTNIVWYTGMGYYITWNSIGNVGPYIKIELYKTGKYYSTINFSAENNGSYYWLVPLALMEGNDYSIKISSITYPNIFDFSDNLFTISTKTSVEQDCLEIKKDKLFPSYPNPFNPITIIRYEISASSNVQINIYNMVGERIKQLVNDKKEPGSYEAQWDGRNSENQNVSIGLYLVEFKTNGYIETQKITFLK